MDRTGEEDPLYNMLKVDMKNSIVKQWVKNPKEKKDQIEPKEMSIW
jgi:hypothetical protein